MWTKMDVDDAGLAFNYVSVYFICLQGNRNRSTKKSNKHWNMPKPDLKFIDNGLMNITE